MGNEAARVQRACPSGAVDAEQARYAVSCHHLGVERRTIAGSRAPAGEVAHIEQQVAERRVEEKRIIEAEQNIEVARGSVRTRRRTGKGDRPRGITASASAPTLFANVALSPSGPREVVDRLNEKSEIVRENGRPAPSKSAPVETPFVRNASPLSRIGAEPKSAAVKTCWKRLTFVLIVPGASAARRLLNTGG